jgi:hypothetical protein
MDKFPKGGSLLADTCPMPKKTDVASKPPRSDRLRGWWFRGVDTQPPPQREELSNAVRSHLDGMAGHALRIEQAAMEDGSRIRQQALTSANTIVGHVEHLESQLALIENQYGRVIDTMRTELTELRTKLAQEAERAEGAARRTVPQLQAPAPVPAPASGPAPAAVPGNNQPNGRALPAA